MIASTIVDQAVFLKINHIKNGIYKNKSPVVSFAERMARRTDKAI
ncbi:hypothetical protein KGI01_09700 [Kurthia gibsonii]|nr:hypothetical protein KGI01_09700 [Kurthia gibsonii]